MEQFMKEEFDYKRFFLLCIKRIWIVLISVLLCAGLFAGVYALNTKMNADEIYRCDGIYNIEFDMSLFNDTVQYYNDYTWNDVIDSDIIGGKVSERLGLDNSVVYGSTFVPTMSDIRIIHVYVDNRDPQLAADIQNEIAIALAEFGNDVVGFDSIEQWSTTEAVKVEKPFLIKRIVFSGIIIGLVFGILGLAIINTMDDSIYTLADAEKYTGVMPVAIFPKVINGGLNSKYFQKEKESVSACLKVVFDKAGLDGNAKVVCATLYDNAEIEEEYKEWLNTFGQVDYLINNNDAEFFDKLKMSKATILLVKYGNHDGNLIRARVSNLKKIGINVESILVMEGDLAFLRGYYGK